MNTMQITTNYHNVITRNNSVATYILLTERSAEIWVAYNMMKYMALTMVLFGTASNVLSTAVLLRVKMRLLPGWIFLIWLGFADTVALWSGLTRSWVLWVFEIDIWSLNNGTCKIIWFLRYFSSQASSWILMAFTVERLISVMMPLRSKLVCTKRNGGVIIATILSFLFLSNSHMFFGMGILHAVLPGNSETINDNRVADICTATTAGYKTFWRNSWHPMELPLRTGIPFVVIIICNTGIIIQVAYSRRKSAKLGVIKIHQSNQTRRMTVMLLLLNTVFLISTAPICIFNTWFYIMPDDRRYFPDSHYLARTICRLCLYLNNCVNFLLYCISGPRFGQELREMFGCAKKSVWV